MRTVLVTLQSARHTIDMNVPAETPIEELLPNLVEACLLAEPGAARSALEQWRLALPTGEQLPPHRTLTRCGIVDGMRILVLDYHAWQALHEKASPSLPALAPIVPGPETGGIGVAWSHEGFTLDQPDHPA